MVPGNSQTKIACSTSTNSLVGKRLTHPVRELFKGQKHPTIFILDLIPSKAHDFDGVA